MGKDGGGPSQHGGFDKSSSGCTNCKCKTVAKPDPNQVQISAIAVINKELERLHQTLREGNGDDDITQDQISTLHNELSSLLERME